MATNVTFNNISYPIPNVGDTRWGQAVTNFLLAVGNNALSKAGGNFTISSDINFGANYGLIAKYLKSGSTNIAQSEVVRLANNEGMAWRNAAGTADVVLKVNASDQLEFAGGEFATVAGLSALDTRLTTAESDIDALQAADIDMQNDIATNTTNISDNAAAIATKADAVATATALGTKAVSPLLSKGDLWGFSTVDARIPAGTNDQVLTVDSSTATGLAWKVATAGSGAGEKNYITLGTDNATGWQVFGAGLAVTTETNAINFPDNSTKLSAIKFLRSSGTAYAYKQFTLDQVDYNKKLKVQLDQAYAGTVGDYTVRVFQNTAPAFNGTYTELSVSPSTSLAAGVGQTTKSFDSPGSSAPYLEVRVYANAGTTPLYLNNFLVGPGTVGTQPAVSGPIAYVPAVVGFGTVTNNFATYRQTTSNIRMIGTFTPGTPTAVNATIPMPNGYTAMNQGGATLVVGRWYRNMGTAGNTKGGTLFIGNGNNAVNFGVDGTENGSSPVTALLGSGITGSEGITYDFSVDVNQLAGSNSLIVGPGAQVEYVSDDGTNDVFGPNGSPVPNLGFSAGVATRSFSFSTPTSNTQDLSVELNYNGFGWLKASDIYPYSAGNNVNSSNHYGIQAYWSSPTVFNVQFGLRGPVVLQSNTDNSGASWAQLFAAGCRFRVVRASPSAPVGIVKANANESGLVAPRKGQTALTVTGTGFTNIRSVGIYEQDQDGNHMVEVNIYGTATASARGGIALVVSGITSIGSLQCVSSYTDNGTAVIPSNAYIGANSGSISVAHASASTVLYAVTGTIHLASKPTWA